MIAAIYARKSTAQNGDEESRSVTLQIENARAFAAARGWRVAEDHVYADDNVSGAETWRLKQRVRLIETIDGGGVLPFQVLIVRNEGRFSRRDGEEAFAELKRLTRLGLQIWFYQSGTRFTYGSFGENVVGFVRAEMNAEYRRQIALDTHAAMIKKAKLGHVTGGACFGYDNHRVNGHTERTINETEAAVIRRIFALCIDGAYHKRGTTVCRNALKKPIATLDGAVIGKLRDRLRRPIVEATIDGVFRALAPPTLARDLQRHRRELAAVDREIANLTAAIAQGGTLPPLVEALTARHTRRETLTVTIAAQEAVDVTRGR